MNGNSDAMSQGNHTRIFLWFLILTALLCGGLVMVIEVLGSRVIGPFYGVSLFVWTSLITVTLVALAGGYAVGGVMSDRWSSPAYLYGIILVSGIFALLVPVLKLPVLKMCEPLGLRLGALTSSAMLFGPSLFLLGCVSPYIVKIAARQLHSIGTTVGTFYAVSTIGSFIGTVVTGFFLIAYMGVARTFSLVGASLIGLSIVYFVVFRKRWAAVGLALIPFLIPSPDPVHEAVMPRGTKVTLVHSKASFYGDIKVVDYTFGALHTRELMIDGFIHTGIDYVNRMSVYPYAYFVEFLPFGLGPDGKRCLVVGMGAGAIAMWYEARGVTTDVVEIDPEVARIARDFFDFRTSGEVIIADARQYLNRPGKIYDYVILDVFSGDSTPGHVLSYEALAAVRSHMTQNGILAINIAGSLKEKTYMTASVLKTVERVFDTVQAHPIFDPEGESAIGNVAVIAYDGPPRPFDRAAVADFAVHPLAREEVDAFLVTTFRFPADTPAIVLTDDYNPIDFYDSWLREEARRHVLEETDWDILAGSR